MIGRFGVPIDEYLRRCDGIVDEFERMKIFSKSDEPMEIHRSHEYGSLIIHSMVTGTPRVVYGNMPNRGAISSLPDTAIAEGPTLVDRAGLQMTRVGELPPQLVGYMQPHVTQQELFIRAAMEGRRDHVYQAAMFDPLTAATLTLDQIVEMCDELIAAHGDLLPNLDAKKTLVPSSGKRFSPPTAGQLRESWDAAQKSADEDFVRHWHVLGPYKIGDRGRTSLQYRTAFEDDFVNRADGGVDLKAAQRCGDETFHWLPACAGKKGLVDLDHVLGRHEFAIAYAYAEVESIHGRDCVLGVGSDDGVRVYVNGRQVHDNDAHRAYTPNADRVSVRLNAGVNRILLKIDNYTAGWGFGVSVPKANF